MFIAIKTRSGAAGLERSGEAHVRMDENEIKLGIQHLRLLHLLLGPTALFFLQLGHGRLELTQLLSQRFKI